MRAITSDVWQGSQSWERRDVLEIDNPDGTVTAIELHIDRDAYDEQSTATVKFWDRSSFKWNTAITVNISLLPTVKGFSYMSDREVATRGLQGGMDELVRRLKLFMKV